MWMEKTPDGKFKYRERYTDPYTEKHKTVSVTMTSNSRQAANKAQRHLNEEISKRLSIKVEKSDTFKNVLDSWEIKYKHTVKDTSYWRNKWNLNIIRTFLTDDMIVKNIDTALIQNKLDNLYYKKGYSLSVVKNCKSLIRIIFEYAKECGLCENNPTDGIIIKRKALKYDEFEKIENKYLEKSELSKILSVLRNDFRSKRYADLTEFMALTGLRFGEAVALEYSALSEKTLMIDSTLDYTTRKSSSFYKTLPKTAAAIRRITLSDRAVDILQECQLENTLNESTRFREHGFYFTSRLGNPIAICNFNDSLKRAAKKAGVPKHMSSHILRHTHISILAEKKIPIKAIMERVGHTDAEVTTKIYTHVTDEMQKDIVSSLNEIEF